MRFDDDEHLKAYHERGEYPKIHDDIFSLNRFVKVDNVVDLGSCTGLLSRRLADKYKLVIGIEPSKKYVEKAIQGDNIKYINMGINEDTLGEFAKAIRDNNIKAVYARRVVPEIYETGGMELVRSFITALYDTGVEYVILEGRKSTKKAKNPLHSIDEEVKMFDKLYFPTVKYRNCQILKRRG